MHLEEDAPTIAIDDLVLDHVRDNLLKRYQHGLTNIVGHTAVAIIMATHAITKHRGTRTMRQRPTNLEEVSGDMLHPPD